MAWFAFDYHRKSALQLQQREVAEREYRQALQQLASVPWSELQPQAVVLLEGTLRGNLRLAPGGEADPSTLVDPIDDKPCLGYQLVYLRKETRPNQKGIQSTTFRLVKRDIQLASRLSLETPEGVLTLDTSQLQMEKKMGSRAVPLTDERSRKLGAKGASLVRVLRIEPGETVSLHGQVMTWSSPRLTLHGDLCLGSLQQNARRWVHPRRVPVPSFLDYMKRGPLLLVMILLMVGRIVLRVSLSKRRT